MAASHRSNLSCISYQHSHYKSRKLPVKPTLTSRPTSAHMPYRPNIIPQRSPGFLSSITNSLSFPTLGAGGTAGNSKSVSAGGNLAELRCELLRLCELQEMPGCSVGGRAGPGPASPSGQAQGKLGGSCVSESNLDFVPCCWWASAPWNGVFAFTGSFFQRFWRS